ncbi:MAG: sulfotransferase [Pyrinomonadaceae bacterium]|nr:sulfotransferase [Pyrinomonadaceae bacterium]
MMPNFLVIGAAKAGTTALHSYLAQHPDIYMSATKEIRFF